MHLRDMNWMDVERYLRRDDRIILVTGATEQHAYLSLQTDVLISEKIAAAVTMQEPVVIAPSINYGVSKLFADYPGTIPISEETFSALLMDVVHSLLSHGFRRFFIINGHNGNRLPVALRDMEMQGTLRVQWYDWWCGQAVRDFEQAHALQFEHGNWAEAFPFNRVVSPPENIKPSVNIEYVNDGHSVREVAGDGSFGGPYQIGAEMMTELFQRIVHEAAEKLATLRREALST